VQPVPHAAKRAVFAFAFAALASLIVAPVQAAQAPALRDQNGKTFALSSFRGTPVILTFVSAHCRDACPLINAQFEAMQTQLKRSGLKVHLVTLSLDPDHDALKDMRQIATTFEANPRYWTVGTAAGPQERALMQRFGVVAHRGSRDYDDIHTTYVYLLDRRGRLVKTILASSNLPADLFAELERSWNKLTA
jgi:cytochrome oxidase Cu insertion factor (SCO1/SenC/PrrC family)